MNNRIPRRYAKPIRFLTQLVSDERVTTKLRMEAAMRLTAIYMSYDEAQLRRDIAKERASARKAEAEARAAGKAAGSPADGSDSADPSMGPDASAIMSCVMEDLMSKRAPVA